MTYEKEIPDYAMVPAKEIEEKIIVPVTKGAIYSPVQVTNITEKPKTVITIEEDILVPDTKPDLREILLIDGRARLASREIDQMGKGDDHISLAGEIELQTLYMPENQQVSGPVIAVQTRVPFKEQWHTGLASGATLTASCKVEKIDYMVINERKYRVKISLAISARECVDSKVDVFEGITGEEIQMLREKVEITNIALRKKDTLSISEVLEIKEDETFEAVLKQDITVVENYKQLTGEKLVVNGFIFVNLLYTVAGSGEEGPEGEGAHQRTDCIRQARERVEFTQFIPVSGGSGSEVCFDGSGLRVKLVSDEELGEVLKLEGEIITHVEVYRTMEKEIIVDGYHREKDFVCDFGEKTSRVMVGTTAGESSVREIISPDQGYGDVEKIIYTTGEIASAGSHCEQGKVITEGSVLAKIICQSRPSKDAQPQIFSMRQEVPFRVVANGAQLSGDEMVSDRIYIKDIWAEKINNKQIEFNAAVVCSGELMRQVPFKVLVNPAFEEKTVKERAVPMVVYITRKGDSLWSVAKKFKTTMESIIQLNQLEEGVLHPGQKLLILK